MQTFLLACYICLQLTNLPDLDKHEILKRGKSCDECLTGIFDQSELYSYTRTEQKQTTGGLLASNRPLKQALEERLMLELSRGSYKSKQKEETMQQAVPQDQISKAQMMVEDAVKAGELAMKTIQEKVVLDIKRKTEEMALQLQQQQAQLARELELQGVRQREILMREMETMKQSIKDFTRQNSQRGTMDALLNNYMEYMGGLMKDSMKEVAKLTLSDWDNLLNEAKSALNKVTSQDIREIVKEVQSVLTGAPSQDINNLMKEIFNKEQPKPKKIPNRNVLQNEVKFTIGESLICENGRYKMKMQKDATLVIIDQYQNDQIVKTIGTSAGVGKDYHLVMQGDGNLVIYSEIRNGKGVNPTWHSGTNSLEGRGFYLRLENNGQLVMYNQAGRQIWTSGRSGWKHDMLEL